MQAENLLSATTPEALSGVTDFQSAKDTIAAGRTRLQDYSDCDQQALSRAQGLLDSTQERIAAEETCRASQACTAERQAKRVAAKRESDAAAICDAIETAKLEEAIIAEERANPSGVVDLKRLHDAGAILAEVREAQKQLKAQWQKDYGKPFDAKVCQETQN
jgi:hypothetical protein